MFKISLKAIFSAFRGLMLTLRHLFAARKSRKHLDVRDAAYFGSQEGVTTVQFPKEKMPIPEVARYQLEVEIDDCIVCDLCAKACPVDCIDIEAIKSAEVISKTSDGSTKRLYAAKFDIDMAKCMYCGLCTVVCPTECITMTDNYDRSTTRLDDLIYTFAEMSEAEIDAKRREYEAFQMEKTKEKK